MVIIIPVHVIYFFMVLQYTINKIIFFKKQKTTLLNINERLIENYDDDGMYNLNYLHIK